MTRENRRAHVSAELALSEQARAKLQGLLDRVDPTRSD